MINIQDLKKKGFILVHGYGLYSADSRAEMSQHWDTAEATAYTMVAGRQEEEVRAGVRFTTPGHTPVQVPPTPAHLAYISV